MGMPLSSAKVVLLAAHFAACADIDNLCILVAGHFDTLRKDLLLRIILTYLPETVNPTRYVPLLQAVDQDRYDALPNTGANTNSVQTLSEEQATQRAKKLHLIPLSDAVIPKQDQRGHDDYLTAFLFQRAYRVDEEGGMLAHVPNLLLPFLHIDAIRTWTVSTVLPLVRRSQQYYMQPTLPLSLREFEGLPDRSAIQYLLSGIVQAEHPQITISRDLRGLIAPWLHNEARWVSTKRHDLTEPVNTCPGWEQVLEWLTAQASSSWPLAVSAFEQWDGPSQDGDLGDGVSPWFQDDEQAYLDQGYARAALACAYLITEATTEAIEGAYRVISKIRSLLDHDSEDSLQDAMRTLPGLPDLDMARLERDKAAGHMRNNLLSPLNPLSAPEPQATSLLKGLVVSAGLMQRLGVPCTVRRAGDLLFFEDRKEQKGEAAKLIRTISNKAPRGDEQYWVRAKREVLWLHSWAAQNERQSGKGILGLVPQEYLQGEFLKALLANSHYELARKTYQDRTPLPISQQSVQDAVQSSALHAFDNASNPNRTRGGLKKCDEIIHAFPRTVPQSLPMVKRIVALLKATHALSEYKLVLKQGEPFNPVVLRVHSDPVAIIERVLEQNRDSYTRLNEFLEMGQNLSNAGLSVRQPLQHRSLSSLDSEEHDIAPTEKRIVAMCIEAALREDDFETAYSYVVSRLSSWPPHGSPYPLQLDDNWSWSAALKAGQYVRTSRSQAPTHLGTSSGNPEIRHLEQRIECLSTAIRVAPPSQLLEILKTFRRCEEQLDSAVNEEAEKEAAWDAEGDRSDIPGSFSTPNPDKAYPPRNITASGAARQAEEAPMSLFDLSRATARVAQRNFTALSNLQGVGQGLTQSHNETLVQEQDGRTLGQRTRKRDQLREAATGTLVSGVGWLIGANMNQNRDDDC